MAELSWFFWLFVGLPICAFGVIMLAYIGWREWQYKRELEQINTERRGWRR